VPPPPVHAVLVTRHGDSQCERGQPLAAPQCLDTSVHTTGMSFKNVALSRKWRLGRAVVS
jgi:hypothetical protein